MEKIYIICVEDQREVLHAIVKDLSVFEEIFPIEECETAVEAEELLDEIDAEGDNVGVIVSDHVMPGKSGVDFLIEINKDPRFRHTRKLLLTGLATHEDTINAINNADIDRFIEKPWLAEKLVKYVRILLTEFILEKGIDYHKYLNVLDKNLLFRKLRRDV
ncbi:MAG: response regulator [Bacteroidetes bacterium]|nr:response regulator [Bacteroidota bacterium]